ncbi:MAG: DoxX family protein [Candidatus Paceibacterota bacterium]|jgi:putative oxidoreductase
MILNTFPQLLTFGIFAPLVLRIIIGFIAINLGSLKLTKERSRWTALFDTIHFRPAGIFIRLFAVVEIIGGLMLIGGAYTQIVAIVFSMIYLASAILEYREEGIEERTLPFYVLMLAISFSLIFTGAGAFGFDIIGL